MAKVMTDKQKNQSYTPAPWHVFRDTVAAESGLTLATVTQFVPEDRPQSDSNARLMAAAPGMLIALEEIASASGEEFVRTIARAAIKNAKG